MSNFTFPWKQKSGLCAVLACDLMKKLNGVAKFSFAVKYGSIYLTNVTKKFSTTWFSCSGIWKIEDTMPYSAQEKVLILEQFMENQSVTVTQRWVRRTMDGNPPSRNDILWWHEQFRNSGNLAHGEVTEDQEGVGRILRECISCFKKTTRRVPVVLQLDLEYHALRFSEFWNSACIRTLRSCKIYTPFWQQARKSGCISLRIVKIDQ